MAQYLPAFRPGDTVTFDVTAAVTGGRIVELGTADRAVAPAGRNSPTPSSPPMPCWTPKPMRST